MQALSINSVSSIKGSEHMALVHCKVNQPGRPESLDRFVLVCVPRNTAPLQNMCMLCSAYLAPYTVALNGVLS